MQLFRKPTKAKTTKTVSELEAPEWARDIMESLDALHRDIGEIDLRLTKIEDQIERPRTPIDTPEVAAIKRDLAKSNEFIRDLVLKLLDNKPVSNFTPTAPKTSIADYIASKNGVEATKKPRLP